jgi:hypothetical protein
VEYLAIKGYMMKRSILHIISAFLFVVLAGGATVVTIPQTAFAAVEDCGGKLLTFPNWYDGVTQGCEVVVTQGNTGVQKFVLTVGLNIVEMILQLVGYIAVGFIIYGGYKYMISAGSADGMTKARKTITNAVIGLLISIFSVVIVNVIGGAI